MRTWQRAVREEQRDERRETILAAAEALFLRKELAAIGMAEVARRAGLAKGTLYLYFPTKESLFLAFLSRDYELWFDAMDRALRKDSAPMEPHALAQIAVKALRSQPTMRRLMAELHTLLERNIDQATALPFKRMLLERVTRAGALLESRCAFLRPGDGAAVLAHLHALVIGLQHMAQPAPVIAEILRRPELSWFRLDFYPALARAFEVHLIGLQTLAGMKSGPNAGKESVNSARSILKHV